MDSIVQSAIYKLKELEYSMKTNERKFKDEDIENIDLIADYLQQAENEVKKTHEDFEAETIMSSVLRHKLGFFPNEIKLEIQGAVKAARDSNMIVIDKLKVELDSILKSIENCNQKDEEYTNQIFKQQSEKKALLSKHEEVVTSLNQSLTSKAESRIKLNEVRTRLEETKQSTIDLEEDILIVKEQLVIDKAKGRAEKTKLLEENVNTQGLLLLQQSKNETKNREATRVLENLKASDEKLRELYQENERLEATVSELSNGLQESESALADEKKHLEYLKLENARLIAKDKEIQENYDKTRTLLTNETININENKEPIERLKKLKTEEDSVREDLKIATEKFKNLHQEVNELTQKVENSKLKATIKLKEMTRLDSENKAAYAELSILEDQHNKTMENLSKELEEILGQLNDEREYKTRKQAERNAKIMEIQAYQSEVHQEQASNQKYLMYGKTRLNDLSKRIDEIERHRIKNDVLAVSLASEEETVVSNYETAKTKMEAEFDHLHTELDAIQSELASLTEEYGIFKPQYDELVVLHEKKLSDTDASKKSVYAKKKEKIYLIDTIKEKREKIGEHDKMRKIVDLQIRIKRDESLRKLKKQNEEIKELENFILDTGMRLENVTEENGIFEHAIEDYSSQIKDLELKIVLNGKNDEHLYKQYDTIQTDLENSHKSDMVIKEAFEKQDIALIQKLSKLLDTSNERESKVHGITDRLYLGIGDLSKYLQDMLKFNSDSQIFVPYASVSSKAASHNSKKIETNSNEKESNFDAFSIDPRCGTGIKIDEQMN